MDVPPLLYSYMILSCVLVLGFALYLAILDFMAYRKINGYQKDQKFGYNYGSAFHITVGFLFCLLPFINILTISLYFILVCKEKRRHLNIQAKIIK